LSEVCLEVYNHLDLVFDGFLKAEIQLIEGCLGCLGLITVLSMGARSNQEEPVTPAPAQIRNVYVRKLFDRLGDVEVLLVIDPA
jgi:hypothetical protein